MKTTTKTALSFALLAAAGCTNVDPQYSDVKEGATNGFPELAFQLGRVREDCVLQAADWEKVFIDNNITTSRRVSNAINGMQQNGQIIFYQDKRVMAVTANYCQK